VEDQEISVRFPVGADIFVSTLSRPEVGAAQPLIQLVPGIFSPGIKRLERESDQLLQFRAEVKNTQSHTSTDPILYFVMHK
jgi:hypothetical protein